MRYALNHDTGDRKRPDGLNEDSVALSTFVDGHREGYGADDDPDSPPQPPATRSVGVVVLADGAGGHDAGDVASYLATTVVAEELAPLAHRAARAAPEGFGVDVPEAVGPDRPTPAEAREAVADAVVAAHRAIVRYAVESGGEAYTTVVAGLYDGSQFHYGWVGDSRAYVVNRETERVESLTADHSVVAEERRAGAIDEVEAATHPRGNEITRALGGTAAKTPETATVEVETASVSLYAEDVVVLTSDGLVDAQTDAPDLFREYRDRDRSDEAAADVREAIVTDADVRDVVLDADSLDDAAVEYVRLANDLGGKDNLSVALFADDALSPTPADPPTRTYAPADGLAERETTIRPAPADEEGRVDDETTD